MSREFDLVIWGATGFTGGLIAQYIAESQKGSGLKWAIAGRSQSKLEQVRAQLISIECKDLPLLLADASEPKSISALAARTRVLISSVGPFMLYGEPIVAACVQQGTHYCDITGEHTWVRRMIDRYHEQAEAKGVYILNCCGFDSIPSDIGCLMVVDHIKRKFGCGVRHVKCYANTNGTASGGTIASVINLCSQPTKSLVENRDPYLLNTDKSRLQLGVTPRAGEADQILPSYDREIKAWTGPWLMAAVNTRVVRRSASLAAELSPEASYGANFTYNECTTNWMTGVLAYLMLLFLMLGGGRLVARFLPQPGTGPSAAMRAKSRFRCSFIGYGEKDDVKVRGVVAGGDPGYTETAKMVSETALCLAQQSGQFARRGGVLTPASACGLLLVPRLQKAGLTLKIESE